MKTFLFRRLFLAVSMLLLVIIQLYSQRLPESKIRREAMKPALFPISDNQKMYDVISYDLNFDFNIPDTSFIGKACITLKPSGSALNQIHLDLAAKSIFNRKANTVDSILVSGKKAGYTHNDTTLIVSLDKTYAINDVVSINVYYHNKLDNFYLMLLKKNNRNLLFNLSEPFGSRFWFPCKDYPEDKADSVRMTITVPEEYSAASNGRLEKVSLSNGKKTFFWSEKYPIATYLISIAIYPYVVYKDYYRYSTNDSMEILNYVFPEDTAAFAKVRNTIPKQIEFFKTLYGEYPFINEKYGHAQVAFSGGMENQTITSLGLWNEYLITHELAHSWFGNSVTCFDFHNIWLNEGFATYSTALYLEKQKSKAEFDKEMSSRKYFGSGTIYREDLNDDMSIFSEGLVYSKASWVLHMLRGITGDEKFFQIMKNYYQKCRYSNADQNAFRSECEKVYGGDLSWFFRQWLYNEYFPTYKYTWQQQKQGSYYKVDLNIEQIEPASALFKMPVQILVKSAAWDSTIVIWDSLKTQSFSFNLASGIDSLFIDKNDFILKKVVSSMTEVIGLDPGSSYSLDQNFPNPFNPSTTISYNVAQPGIVDIKVYDVLGREVSVLVNSYHKSGTYKIIMNASGFSSGIYFYSIKVNNFRDTKKMLLLR